jgi:hypothetical protein
MGTKSFEQARMRHQFILCIFRQLIEFRFEFIA